MPNLYWRNLPADGYVTKETHKGGHVSYRWSKNPPSSPDHVTHVIDWLSRDLQATTVLERRAHADLKRWREWTA